MKAVQVGLFSRKDKTILVIDDSPTVRRTMKSTLKGHFEVELGTDGMDGLKMLMRMTPDLVLLDINMPRLDGFKVLGQIRRDPRFRELPVIVFTDQERMVDVERALSLGANDYIKKAQMEPDEVLEKIQRYVSGNLNEEDGFQDGRMVHEGDAAIVKKYDVPHFARFTHVTGNFIVESVDGIELDFPELVEVGGDLILKFNSELIDLRAFKSLLKVGGNIVVTHNDSLKSLVHLKSVVRVGGDIVVHDNPALNPQHPEKLLAIIKKNGSCDGKLVTAADS